MRIVSSKGFVDYYDCMQQYDQDRETVFVRKACKDPIPTPHDIKNHFIGGEFNCNGEVFEYSTYFFAGDVYSIRVKLPNEKPYNSIRRWSKFYEKSLGEWNEIAQKNALKWSDIYGPLFQIFSKENKIWQRNSFVDTCPHFGAAGFAKILPPDQAYQKLMMWVHNQARPNKPIPELSNADKIVNAGFDVKTSFRKQK